MTPPSNVYEAPPGQSLDDAVEQALHRAAELNTTVLLRYDGIEIGVNRYDLAATVVRWWQHHADAFKPR